MRLTTSFAPARNGKRGQLIHAAKLKITRCKAVSLTIFVGTDNTGNAERDGLTPVRKRGGWKQN